MIQWFSFNWTICSHKIDIVKHFNLTGAEHYEVQRGYFRYYLWEQLLSAEFLWNNSDVPQAIFLSYDLIVHRLAMSFSLLKIQQCSQYSKK